MSGERERILNLPTVVTALIGVLAAVQALIEWTPEPWALAVLARFAFIPARLTYLVAPEAVINALSGDHGDLDAGLTTAMILDGAGGAWVTPLSYAFLHGGWTHLFINVLTLAAFGAPVARRFGAPRFLAFLAACAIAGALAHLAIHPLGIVPVVGASAAISGTMAAIVRFAFTPGARLGETRFLRLGVSAGDPAPARLSELASNRRAVSFLVVWFAVNLFFGAFPHAAGASGTIAWEAHIGGFLFGLMSFTAFDRSAARRRR